MVGHLNYWLGWVNISCEEPYFACLFSITVPRSSLVPTDALIHA